jgi:signal transduction histidine kinase
MAADVDAQWLRALEQLCGRAAHEVRGALNAVAVNVEVVRSRAAAPGADPALARVAPHAATAADNLEAVIRMTGALLTLARSVPEPVRIGPLVRSVQSLLAPAARTNGGDLQVEPSVDALGETSANGHAVLAVMTGVLMAAVDGAPRVVVRAAAPDGSGAGANTVPNVIEIECREGSVPAVNADVAALAAEAGMQIQRSASALSITFPG